MEALVNNVLVFLPKAYVTTCFILIIVACYKTLKEDGSIANYISCFLLLLINLISFFELVVKQLNIF